MQRTTTLHHAKDHRIDDAGGYFTSTDVEGALQEVGADILLPLTDSNPLFRCDSPGGTSAFVGTINGTPSGTSVVYNVSSGTEGAMKPSATTHLAKMRLYNTTRSNYALISDVNTTTNTITLTATAPANWANGDTITIASQTVTGAPINYVDLEITSVVNSKQAIMIAMLIISGTVGDNMRIHPLETYGGSKQTTAQAIVANNNGINVAFIPLVSSVFSFGWTGTPTVTILYIMGASRA